MDLVLVVLGLVLVGYLVWVLTTRVPLPTGWATAIQVVALVLVLLYLARLTGLRLPDVLR